MRRRRGAWANVLNASSHSPGVRRTRVHAMRPGYGRHPKTDEERYVRPADCANSVVVIGALFSFPNETKTNAIGRVSAAWDRRPDPKQTHAVFFLTHAQTDGERFDTTTITMRRSCRLPADHGRVVNRSLVPSDDRNRRTYPGIKGPDDDNGARLARSAGLDKKRALYGCCCLYAHREASRADEIRRACNSKIISPG